MTLTNYQSPITNYQLPMTKFEDYIDLASQRLGGAVLIANDEFFAPKDNLLKPEEAVWKEGKYTDRGKWMDGWETRRRRTPGHDWCIVRLGLPGLVRGVVVDTAYFRGNYPEACSIEACAVEGQPTPEELAEDRSVEWVEILGQSDLEGHSKNRFEIDSGRRFTHLRLRIFPDGGVARLRVHGEPLPDLDRWQRRGEIDLAAIENGGRVIDASDMFFGSANNLMMPGRGKNMGDGWETKRRRGPGHDWVVLQLGVEGHLEHIEVDTRHFKGNYPDRFSLEGAQAPAELADVDALEWRPLLDETKLQAHTRHQFALDAGGEPVTHIRFNIYPDGGVSRLRLYGQPSERGFRARKLEWLNTLPKMAAFDAFLTCCGSTRWAAEVTRARPFASLDELATTADHIWASLGEEDWLEAFSAHPKIGERKADGEQTEKSKEWSEQEQSGTAEASEQVLERLHEQNVAYADRFGFIFIVCASGKSADEMLALLEARIDNDRDTEIEVAAEEQRKITQLRLEKLLT
jgi:allantoicase